MYQIARQKCSSRSIKKDLIFWLIVSVFFGMEIAINASAESRKQCSLKRVQLGPNRLGSGAVGAQTGSSRIVGRWGAVAGRGWLPHPVHFRRARDLFSMSAFRSCRRLGFDLASILTNRSHRSCISDSSEEFLWC